MKIAFGAGEAPCGRWSRLRGWAVGLAAFVFLGLALVAVVTCLRNASADRAAAAVRLDGPELFLPAAQRAEWSPDWSRWPGGKGDPLLRCELVLGPPWAGAPIRIAFEPRDAALPARGARWDEAGRVAATCVPDRTLAILSGRRARTVHVEVPGAGDPHGEGLVRLAVVGSRDALLADAAAGHVAMAWVFGALFGVPGVLLFGYALLRRRRLQTTPAPKYDDRTRRIGRRVLAVLVAWSVLFWGGLAFAQYLGLAASAGADPVPGPSFALRPGAAGTWRCAWPAEFRGEPSVALHAEPDDLDLSGVRIEARTAEDAPWVPIVPWDEQPDALVQARRTSEVAWRVTDVPPDRVGTPVNLRIVGREGVGAGIFLELLLFLAIAAALALLATAPVLMALVGWVVGRRYGGRKRGAAENGPAAT